MDKKYAKAYTEVLEILKHIPKDEYEKIPKSEIQFYESNYDKNYKYMYNESANVKEQKISREANAVIVALYMNYLANEKQKGIIKEILSYNTKKENEEKNIKYNVDKLFSEEHTENLPIKIDEKKKIL